MVDQDEGMKDAEIDDSNNRKVEKDEEEKEAVGIEFTEQKAEPENDKNVIDLWWSDIREKDEEDIAKANLIWSLQKQAIEEFFSKE